MSIKIHGKEFLGKYFENWKPGESLRINLIERVRRRICDKTARRLREKYINRLHADEAELVKLRDFLKGMMWDKWCAVEQARYELAEMEESVKILDDAINELVNTNKAA